MGTKDDNLHGSEYRAKVGGVAMVLWVGLVLGNPHLQVKLELYSISLMI